MIVPLVVGLAVAGAVVLTALTVARASSATPRAGLIAFARPDGIYVMRGDGTGLRALRRGGAAARASGLEWSPDGRKLAFGTLTTRTIGVIDAAARMLLRPTVEGSSPTWSPDGRRLAFTAHRAGDASGVRDVWVMRADGTEQRRLAKTPDRFELQVDWGPAPGRRMVVAADGYFPHLDVIDTGGRTTRRLTPLYEFDSAEPQWSPDGRRIAFMHWERSFRDAELYVFDLGRGSQRRLTHNRVPDSHPAWSPDGRELVFVRWSGDVSTVCLSDLAPAEGPCARSDIYAMNADGSDVRRLTRTRVGEASPTWQPVPR